MHPFVYRHGVLHVEDVALSHIAEKIGTPCYVYSQSAIEAAYRHLAEAFAAYPTLICYALKANSNLSVVRALARLGAGADVVSVGELQRALKAGVKADRIVFSGVGKTREEMAVALDAGILCFNVESEPELEALNDVAAELGKVASLSIRINPDVSAGGHKKITTGSYANKFGHPFENAPRLYQRIKSLSNLKAVGIDMHIGSQISKIDPYEAALKRLTELTRWLLNEGFDLRHIDIGGGMGTAYRSGYDQALDISALANAAISALRGFDLQLIIEPGRWLVANAGLLLTKVIYVKRGAVKTFIVTDSGMNDFIRPTLYEAYHEIVPVSEPEPTVDWHDVDVVGPICETGDFFAENRPMPKVGSGDLLAILTAGAYGAVHAGTYNTRPLIPEVMVYRQQFSAIRERQKLEDLIALDLIPPWL